MGKNDDAPDWAYDLGSLFGRAVILAAKTAVIVGTVLIILWAVGVI